MLKKAFKQLILASFVFQCSLIFAQTPLNIKIEGPKSPAINNAKKRVQNLAQHLSQQGSKPLQEVTSRLIQAIERGIEPFGYFSSTIHTKSILYNNTPFMLFQVDLGEPILLDSVELTLVGAGQDIESLRNLIRTFPLKKGMILNTELYKKAKNIFAKTASDLGFINNDFIVEKLLINTESKLATIKLQFDTGPQYAFGPTYFNKVPLKPILLNRFLNYREGDPFQNDALAKLQESLGKSGYFSHVVISPDLPAPPTTTQPQESDLYDKKIELSFALASSLQSYPNGFVLSLDGNTHLSKGFIPISQPLEVFPIDLDSSFDPKVMQSIVNKIDTLQAEYPDQQLVLFGRHEPATSVASLMVLPWFPTQSEAKHHSQFKTAKTWVNIETLEAQSLQDIAPQAASYQYLALPPTLQLEKVPIIPIHIMLEPKQQHAHKVSLGYGTNNGIRSSLQGDYPLLNKSGHKLQTSLTLSKKLSVAETKQRSVRVDTDYPLEISLHAQYSIPGFNPGHENFVLESTLNRLSYYTPEGRKPSKNINISARYVNNKSAWSHSTNMSYLHETSKSSQPNQAFDILSPSALWTLQKTDQVVHPTKGFITSLQLRGATNIKDNKHNFFSVRTGWRQLIPIQQNLRLISRIDLGYLSLLKQNFVPKSYQLLSGGSTSFRGFDYMAIGPGKIMGIISLDTQIKLTEPWYLGVFADAGNVYTEWKKIKTPTAFSDYTKKSYGLTLTNQTPIGALTVTYARAKKHAPKYDRWKWKPKWHVSIGSEI